MDEALDLCRQGLKEALGMSLQNRKRLRLEMDKTLPELEVALGKMPEWWLTRREVEDLLKALVDEVEIRHRQEQEDPGPV